MSASATTRALPVSTRFDASSVPRPPQPSNPTRTAEFAAVPRTNSGLISIAPAVAAATPINFRRPILSEQFGPCFVSPDIDPPSFSSRANPGRCDTLPDQLLKIGFRRPHVFHLLRAGNLTLDSDRALIVELFQTFNDARKIHFPLANGNFLAEFFRIRGEQSVLGVDSLNVGPKQFKRVHRIGFAVEDQVCEVKVEALIVQAHVLHGAHQRDGRLLARFVTEILAVVLAIANHFLHRCDRFLVNEIVGIFRYESAMRLDGRDSALFGKVRRFLDVRNPRRPRLARNQSNRERPLIKVPNFLAGPSHNKRRRLNLMLLQRLTQPADKLHLELIYKHLASRQAEVAPLGHRRIGILPDADDQAKPQRLFPIVGGYMRRALANTKGL